jgi:hypothetical protein
VGNEIWCLDDYKLKGNVYRKMVDEVTLAIVIFSNKKEKLREQTTKKKKRELLPVH